MLDFWIWTSKIFLVVAQWFSFKIVKPLSSNSVAVNILPAIIFSEDAYECFFYKF